MFHQISKFMHDISCFFGAMMIMTFWYHDVCVCVFVARMAYNP